MTGYLIAGTKPHTQREKGMLWEHSMIALSYAQRVNDLLTLAFRAMKVKEVPRECLCGWFEDKEKKWEGSHRVISLNGGEIIFHIPDDFEIGKLPRIEPNWNSDTKKEAWDKIAEKAGAKIKEWKTI